MKWNKQFSLVHSGRYNIRHNIIIAIVDIDSKKNFLNFLNYFIKSKFEIESTSAEWHCLHESAILSSCRVNEVVTVVTVIPYQQEYSLVSSEMFQDIFIKILTCKSLLYVENAYYLYSVHFYQVCSINK